MRNSSYNLIDNSLKKFERSISKYIDDEIYSKLDTKGKDDKNRRNGFLSYGALQMQRLDNSSKYACFGLENSPPIVGR